MTHKVAVVTGGGKGIGRATALRLARDGMYIAVVDLDPVTAAATAEDISQQTGCDSISVQADVSRRESVHEAVEAILEHFGRIDVLVNNAGILSLKKPFVKYTKEEWDRVFGVNLMGDVFFTQEVLPTMMEQKSGSIINLSSVAAHTGGVSASPIYSASKAAVMCLTKSLAGEMAPHGIRVNGVAPGYIATDMTIGKNATGNSADGVPMKRLGEPEEVASVISFLAGDDSSYLTGVTVDINGGTLMR